MGLLMSFPWGEEGKRRRFLLQAREGVVASATSGVKNVGEDLAEKGLLPDNGLLDGVLGVLGVQAPNILGETAIKASAPAVRLRNPKLTAIFARERGRELLFLVLWLFLLLSRVSG